MYIFEFRQTKQQAMLQFEFRRQYLINCKFNNFNQNFRILAAFIHLRRSHCTNVSQLLLNVWKNICKIIRVSNRKTGCFLFYVFFSRFTGI